MFGLGVQELLMIMVIALLFFWGKTCQRSLAG